MSFDAKIVTDDDNIPLTESGELDLPLELSELGKRLQVESAQLAVDYPASPRRPGSSDVPPPRTSSLVWRVSGGVAAACLVVASAVAWNKSLNGPSDNLGTVPAQGSLADTAGSFHDLNEMAAGSAAERARYLSPAVQATPLPPLEDSVTQAELLDRVDLLERAVEGYQFAVERLHEQVQQRDLRIEELQKQIETADSAPQGVNP